MNITNNENKTNITNTIKKNSNYSPNMENKNMKKISQTNVRKNVKVLEFEDVISREQLLKENKTNFNKSISSNIINFSIYDKKNIINISNENINIDNLNNNGNINNDKNNNLNDTNKKSIVENSVLLEKNDYYINNTNTYNNKISNDATLNIISPRNSEEQILSNLPLKNENGKDNKIEDEKEDETIKKNNSINEKQNDASNIINTNPININYEINKGKEKEENIIETKKENSKINEVNNDETINNDNNDINSDFSKDFYSKTMKINKNKTSFNNYNTNFNDIKLNYLTEFYSPNPNKSLLLEQQNKIINEKKSEKTQENNNKEKIENEEEEEKEELEDEVGSIDEFNNVNDNRSVLSTYIFSSIHLTENKSVAPSVGTKTDCQDINSNFNDAVSNRGGIGLIPKGMNSKEFEFKFDKGMNFIPFINGPKNNNNKMNVNILNIQMNNSIKKMKEKISEKDKLIKKNNDNIIHMKKKIKIIDDESKQYERWIQKEEDENERLVCLLNYLMGKKS